MAAAIVSGWWMSWNAVVRSIRSQPGQHLGGHGVGELARPLEHLGHPLVDVPAHDPGLLGLRVHRDDAPGLVADEVDDRVGHLPAAAEQLDLAEQHRLGARLELALPPGLVEEGDLAGSPSRR